MADGEDVIPHDDVMREREIPEDLVPLNDEQLGQMRVPELKTELRRRRLRVSGAKRDLVARLRAALTLEREHGEQGDEDDDENEDDDDDEEVNEFQDVGDGNGDAQGDQPRVNNVPNRGIENAQANNRVQGTPVIRRPRNRTPPRAQLTFRDVEESLEKFSGDDYVSVKKWVADFEEMADMCEWSDVQKVAYAKRLLTGSAKMYINHERVAKTWIRLKSALLEEFEQVVDSFQIHQQLSQRKKKSDETYQQYIYKMLEIAAQASVDMQSVIQYIVQGIPDEAANKALLYGAKSVKQLKERFVQYEALKRDMKTKNKPFEKKDDKNKRSDGKPFKKNNKGADNEAASKVKRCYNCGEKDHISAECPEKEKGAKCFKCGEFGHIATKCTNDNKAKQTFIVSRPNKKKHMKEVILEDCKFVALVDTGSDLTFIRMDEYEKIGSPTLRNRKLRFEGLGSTGNMTLGEFSITMFVDGISFYVTLHVVPKEILKHSVLLGTDFLDRVELRVKRGVVSFLQLDDSLSENSDVPDIFSINTIDEAKEIDLSHIREQRYRDEIANMIEAYDPDNKTRDVGIKTKIILKSDVPVVFRPRRLSVQEKNEVNKIIETWLARGIIRSSTSEYASPIVLVKKKDGSTRLCVDYRALNKIILRPHFPLPLIDDQLDSLQGAEYFTAIDLKDGFFHVPVEEESQKYTSFVTPNGQYEFLKTPFGLCVSPCVFSKYIMVVFKELIDEKIVVVYQDDVNIRARDIDEAIINLKKVLAVAEQHGLVINWGKCQFLLREIEYLGHIITKDSIRPSERKTKAVKNFQRPTNVKQVQSWLGLTGYFRKFIKGYSAIAKPLTDLLKKGVKFEFGMREIEAFETLKTALITKPVLRLYRVGAETELHTDASRFGYGAILLQLDNEDRKFHPVYYGSGKTTPAEEKYASYELEVLAIVKALQKFRVYLLGIPFKIITDCQAFAMTMRKKDLCVRVARWALQLEDYEYEVCHRPGKNMQHVDALSRYPLPSVLLISENENDLITRLRNAQSKDEELEKIIDAATRSQVDGYILKNDLLYRDTGDDVLVVVPKCMQTQVVRQAHERGHFGISKTEAVVKKDFWFKGLRQKVERVVTSCLNCILAERKQGRQEGYLHSIDKGDLPLDTYHIDHVGPMTSTKKKYQHIFVVVDAFTKFVWLYPTKSTDAAEVIDRLRKQSAVFGNPRRIISDRGTAFTSNAFLDYCQEEKIEHAKIVTGVPRGNGQVERVNRTLIPLLSKLAAPIPEDWYKYVDTTQKYLNATPNRGIGKSPFQLLFGVHARLKDDHQIKELLDKEWVARFDEKRDELREEAKKNIAKVQADNRKNYDKKRKEPKQYKEGDLVAIKRTQFGAGLKLKSKFFGPYKITRVLRNDRYVVEKIGEHEGPNQTSVSVDHVKPWAVENEDEMSNSEEDDENI